MHLISSNTDSEIGEDQIDVEYSGEECLLDLISHTYKTS